MVLGLVAVALALSAAVELQVKMERVALVSHLLSRGHQ